MSGLKVCHSYGKFENGNIAFPLIDTPGTYLISEL